MASLPSSVYPLARRDDSVVDDFHGTKICDPYRALEDPDAEETAAYVKALNEVSEPFLKACPIRDKIKARLTELWDYPKYGVTRKKGQFYFYNYNTGLQNQGVLYIQESLEKDGKVFLDPNTLSEDGTTALGSQTFTEDGTLLAYSLQEKGSDWQTVKFKKVPSGEDLPDILTKLKFSGVSWDHENAGVFYSMYPSAGKAVGSATEQLEYHSLYYHRMGTQQSEDMLCYDFPDNPEFMMELVKTVYQYSGRNGQKTAGILHIFPVGTAVATGDGEVTEDGRFLIVSADKGCDPTNLLYFFDMTDFKYGKEKLVLKPIMDIFEAKVNFVESDGDNLIIQTNLDAPMFKVVTVNARNPRKENWKTLVPENEKAKLDFSVVVNGNKLLLCYMEDVKHKVYVHDLKSGERLYEIPLGIGELNGLSGKKADSEIFYGFTSFLDAGSVFRLDLANEKLEPQVLRRTVVKGFDPSEFETEQVFYPSKDGTKVPMYLVYKKGLVKNGENTTMLYGYGGFNIPLLPSFSITRVLFIQNMQGIYAMTNLRGGSEYGERWHEGGMKERKQNVFDDFITAAEYLIDNKYTTPNKLLSHGGSNGGLLVAACAEQRPELFGAVLNRVGVMDMLRYHKFTIGKAWVPEFGSPDTKDEFDYLIKYSPLHNLRIPDGDTEFPAMMLMTADHDDRVVPLHSLKYMAELYHKVKECSKQKKPLIITVEVKAGHGHGKPTAKLIEEHTDIFCFIARVMNVEWKE